MHANNNLSDYDHDFFYTTMLPTTMMPGDEGNETISGSGSGDPTDGSIVTTISTTMSTNGTDSSSVGGLSTGAIVGIVIGVVVFVVLVALLVIIIIVLM